MLVCLFFQYVLNLKTLDNEVMLKTIFQIALNVIVNKYFTPYSTKYL